MKRAIGISRLLPLVLLCGLSVGLIGGCEYFNLSLEEFATRQAELAAKPGGGPSDPGENPGKGEDPGEDLDPLAAPPPGVVLPPSVAPALAKARLWGVDFASLRDALDFANQWALAAGRPEITLLDSITLPETGATGYTISKNIKLIADSGGKTITRNPNPGPDGFTGSLFTVASGWSLELGGPNSLTLDGNYEGSGLTAHAPLITVQGKFTMSGSAVTLRGNTNDRNINFNSDINNVGSGVYVEGGAFTMNGGSIIGTPAKSSFGVFIQSGSFTMNGGSIRDNFNEGLGVFLFSGSFTMNDGSIVENNYMGVYIVNDSFTMNGGSIAHNWSESGAGVAISSTGFFTMNGGSIIDNFARNGAGVYMEGGSFTMTGGSITGNMASHSVSYHNGRGGGVYVDNGGSFIMSGTALISGNSAGGASGAIYPNGSVMGPNGNGGGVYVKDGSFTMSETAVISGNYANNDPSSSVPVATDPCGSGKGGGVFVDNTGSFTMNGGSITGNTATDTVSSNRGGVFVFPGGIFNNAGGTVSGNTPAP